MILEQCKALVLQMDMHPGERMFFFTTTGWMMWNFLVSALLVDVVPVLYDGNPAYPEPDVLWSMVERTGASYFGASPTYVSILEKAGIVPKDRFDLSRLELRDAGRVTGDCRMHGVVLPQRKSGYLGGFGQRRHGSVLRHRRRSRDDAGVRGRDPGAAARVLRPLHSTSGARRWSMKWANW